MNDIRERLAPAAISRGCRDARLLATALVLGFSTEMFAEGRVLHVSYDEGTVINLVPAFGAEPELADRMYHREPWFWSGRATRLGSTRTIS